MDNTPIGLLPDGTINAVDPDAPPFEPTVLLARSLRAASCAPRAANEGVFHEDFELIRAHVLSEIRRLEFSRRS